MLSEMTRADPPSCRGCCESRMLLIGNVQILTLSASLNVVCLELEALDWPAKM